MAPKARQSSKRPRAESSQARGQPQNMALSERFATPAAAERYHQLMAARPVRQERGAHIAVPEAWNWGPRFLAQPGEAFSTLVREFYANVKDGLQTNICTVRGVPVDFSEEAINGYYGTTNYRGNDYFHRDMARGGIEPGWLDRIAKYFHPAAEWNIRGGVASHMDYRYFKPADRGILDFIKAKLVPNSHKGNVRKDLVLLTYCIRHRETIDIGRIINGNIREVADAKGRFYLGHSYLITHLCQLAGVPIDESQEVRLAPQAFISERYIEKRYKPGQQAEEEEEDGDDDDESDDEIAPQIAAPAPAPAYPHDWQDFMRRSDEVNWFMGTSIHQQNQAHLGFQPNFPPPPPWLQDPQYIPEFYRGYYPPPPPPDTDQ